MKCKLGYANSKFKLKKTLRFDSLRPREFGLCLAPLVHSTGILQITVTHKLIPKKLSLPSYKFSPHKP